MKSWLADHLTKNFRRWEFVVSETAARRDIGNSPSLEHWRNLEVLATQILEPAREALGPIRITSGYRSPALNAMVGGSPTSQHMTGEAVDIIPLACNLSDLYVWIHKNTPYDQCIWEFSEWVHVSHKFVGAQRGEALLAYKRDGKTIYAPITTEQLAAL